MHELTETLIQRGYQEYRAMRQSEQWIFQRNICTAGTKRRFATICRQTGD